MDLDDEELKATKILNGTAIKGKDEIEVGEYVRTKEKYRKETKNKRVFRSKSSN